MMNELFVLGELMEGPQNGYHLRNGMQISLGDNRKISFGVIYPLFDRLKEEGYISLEESSDKKKTKIATITEQGKARFMELMYAPVKKGAHAEDIYLIKLDVMQHLPEKDQLNLLNEYDHIQDRIIERGHELIGLLEKEPGRDHWYAAQKIDLRIEKAEITKKWVERFKSDIKDGKDA